MLYFYGENKFVASFGIIKHINKVGKFEKDCNLFLKIPNQTIFNIQPEVSRFMENELDLNISFSFEGKDYTFLWRNIGISKFKDLVNQSKGLDSEFKLIENGFIYHEGSFLLAEENQDLLVSVSDVVSNNKPFKKSELLPFSIYLDDKGKKRYYIGQGFFKGDNTKYLLFLNDFKGIETADIYKIKNELIANGYSKETKVNLVEFVDSFLKKDFDRTSSELGRFFKNVVSTHLFNYIYEPTDFIIKDKNVTISELYRELSGTIETIDIESLSDEDVLQYFYKTFVGSKQNLEKVFLGEMPYTDFKFENLGEFVFISIYLYGQQNIENFAFLSKNKSDIELHNYYGVPDFMSPSSYSIDVEFLRKLYPILLGKQ